ncbi:hypothetical protein K1719_030034 [Acacia pycnantha]|nr:hypothetical protein K1719_030034 [Acacia pycnantha]
MLLIYEYIPNGTLAYHLHGVRAMPGTLPWNIRMNIGIAIALDIIHRDIKTNNILQDDHFVPVSSQFMSLTNKSDVYSFVVVLIELISSLPDVDITRHRHEINLSTMATYKIQNRALHELVDPTLGFESDQKVRKMINAVVELAFQCLQNLKDMRPSMEEVAETLRDIESDEKHKSKPEVLDISGVMILGFLRMFCLRLHLLLIWQASLQLQILAIQW